MVNIFTQCFRVFNLEHKIRVVVHREKLSTICNSFFHILYIWLCKDFLTPVQPIQHHIVWAAPIYLWINNLIYEQGIPAAVQVSPSDIQTEIGLEFVDRLVLYHIW